MSGPERVSEWLKAPSGQRHFKVKFIFLVQ